MQISATTPPLTALPTDQRPDVLGRDPKTQGMAAEQARKEADKVATAKVFTPAPPLRPNIQDYVDINRTLIALRRM